MGLFYGERVVRKIVHVDMDAFFASVEQHDNPELKGLPVIVGGAPDKRGVVAACSYEARAFGIHSAMASSRAAKLCPQAVFLRPRLSRYREISEHIREIFYQYTSKVEPLSLDEAYLDLTENTMNQPSASILAEKIRQQIYFETGLTATAGVAANKFLAKVASGMNKPNGLTVIHPKDSFDFIQRLPVGKFFGVGKVTEERMLHLGIRTGRDLHACSHDLLYKHFGKFGEFLFLLARGKDERPVESSRQRKSIGSETTLVADTSSRTEMIDILTDLAQTVATACARNNCGARTITLKVRYHDFSTITRSKTLSRLMAEKDDIVHQAKKLLSTTEIAYRPVRLLGISLGSLVENGSEPVQLLLPFTQLVKSDEAPT